MDKPVVFFAGGIPERPRRSDLWVGYRLGRHRIVDCLGRKNHCSL